MSETKPKEVVEICPDCGCPVKEKKDEDSCWCNVIIHFPPKNSLNTNPLPWREKINLYQIHPDAASRQDIAKMAEKLSAKANPFDIDPMASIQTRAEQLYKMLEALQDRLEELKGCFNIKSRAGRYKKAHFVYFDINNFNRDFKKLLNSSNIQNLVARIIEGEE